MKKLLAVLCAAVLAGGLVVAAGEGEKRPEPAKRPEGNWMKDSLQRNKDTVARWEKALPDIRSADVKKFVTDAIPKGKAIVEVMEKVVAAQQEGKDDDARQLMAQSREMQMEFQKCLTLMQTYMEMERTQTMLDDRGKDSPELTANCQKILDLLKKKLDLQTRVADIDAELSKARTATGALGHTKPAAGDAQKPQPPKDAPPKDIPPKLIK